MIDELKAAYAYGLITKDEFDARLARTLASRSYAELAVVLADIPAGLAATPPPLSPAPILAPADARVRAADRVIVATRLSS